MADLPDTHDKTNAGPNRGPMPGIPRWVKVFGIIAIAMVLLFVILHLAGAGFGPGIHGM